MSKPFRTFRMEQLEERQMMAGDIKASLAGSNELRITEASGQTGLNNSVYIRQMGSNTIRVLGTPTADGSISRINGKQYQDFTFKNGTGLYLNVTLGGGNDTVVLNEITRSYNFYIDNMNIFIGALNSPGPDQDSVTMTNVSTRGNISISTGQDSDSVYVDHVSSLNAYKGTYTAAGNLSVSTDWSGQSGADRVAVYNSTFEYSVSVSTGGGVDDVKLMHVATEDMRVDLGDGNNTFLFDDLDVRGPYASRGIELKSGSGRDVGTIRNVKANHVTVKLGDGMDDLALDYISAGKLDLQGEGGADKLSMTSSVLADSVFQSGWETIYTRPNLVVDPLLTTTGLAGTLTKA